LVIGRRKTILIEILIVDDEEIILEASETLTDEGYVCFIVSNIEAFVDIVKTTPGIICRNNTF
jgi:DNA-binding response OmpR family regulator